MSTEFDHLNDADLTALQSRLTTEFHRRDIKRQLQSVTPEIVDRWFKYVKEQLDETVGSYKPEFSRQFPSIKYFTGLGLETYKKDQQ